MNVQHNCYDGKCGPTGRVLRRQERTTTDIEEPCIEHTNQASYLVNTHALHNAALIRKLIPRHLTAPIPHIHPDAREVAHHRMAASLRQAQDVRRAKEAAARKERRETAATKKGKKATAPAVVADENPGAIQGDNAETDNVGGPSTTTRNRPRPRKRTRLAADLETELSGVPETEGNMG